MRAKKIFGFFNVILSALLLLPSCGGNKSDYVTDVQYLTVKLKGSEKWSIIKLETGEVIARDLFESQPSAVIDDMFYVTDSVGGVLYYNVADVKTPINKEKFGSVSYFNEGRAIVSRPGSSLYIIDKEGNEVAQLSPALDRATMFTHGRAVVHSDHDRYGYINTQGDSVTGLKYSYASQFLYDDAAIVSLSSSPTDSLHDITAISLDGKELFSISSDEYQLVSPYFTEGVVPVTKTTQDTLIFFNRSGKGVENPTAAPAAVKDANYKDGALTRAGYYLALKGDRWGLVDKDNKVKIKFDYDVLVDVSATRYVAGRDSVYTLLDENGKRVGKAEFIAFTTPNYSLGVSRGTVDPAVIAANFLQLFNDEQACGARRGATLMDLNSLIGNDPTPYVGHNFLPQMIGSLAVIYHFEGNLARLVTTEGSLPTAQFNLDDRVKEVTMSYDLHQYPTSTPANVAKLIDSAFGTTGFVLAHDNIFTSEQGTAVTAGYRNGMFIIHYYMDAAAAEPPIRQAVN